MTTGAYFYPWYEGRWLSKTIRASDKPLLGEYSSKSTEVAARHLSWAKDAGLDFLAVSYDRSTPCDTILHASSGSGVKITYLYETLRWGSGPAKKVFPYHNQLALPDFNYIAHDMAEENWLRINGRPAIIIYVTRNVVDLAGFLSGIRSVVKNAIGVDPYIVGDEPFWGHLHEDRLALLDAATPYNMYQPGRFFGETDEEICRTYLESCMTEFRRYSEACEHVGIPFWPNVVPGYDDSGVRPSAKHKPIPRMDGKFFEDSLREASTVAKGTIMVTSFSEWYEDTQIEPTESYGSKYLDILKKGTGK